MQSTNTNKKMELINEIDEKNFKTKILKLVKKIERKEVDINFQDQDFYNSTTLMYASRHGYTEIIEFLLKNGADPNMQDNNGRTALVYASKEGYKEIVKLLFKAGADLNIQDMFDDTAIMKAIRQGHIEIVTLLLEAGADLNIRDDHKRTPLRYASQREEIDIVKEILKYKLTIEELLRSFKFSDSSVIKQLIKDKLKREIVSIVSILDDDLDEIKSQKERQPTKMDAELLKYYRGISWF